MVGYKYSEEYKRGIRNTKDQYKIVFIATFVLVTVFSFGLNINVALKVVTSYYYDYNSIGGYNMNYHQSSGKVWNYNRKQVLKFYVKGGNCYKKISNYNSCVSMTKTFFT